MVVHDKGMQICLGMEIINLYLFGVLLFLVCSRKS